MTVKSVIDVEVNDAAFKKFHALFQKYNEQVKKQGDAWNKVGDKIEDTSDTFSSIVKALFTWDQISKQLAKTEENQAVQSHKTESSWKNIAKYTRDSARNIGDNLRTIAKWTSIGTVTSGLLGAGSLFGLDRLAGTVASGRRASLGLGIGYGQRQAFNLNYGRVVDSDNLLFGVSEALHDVTKRRTLYGAGLSESDLKGKDTGQVSLALIQNLKKLADKTPENLLQQVISARGLDQFVSLQDMMRLRNTSAGELSGYRTQYGKDAQSFALSDDTQKRWQNLSVQLGRAGDKIESVLVRGLEGLVDPLSELSDSVSDTIKSFLEGPPLKEWIHDLGDGIKGLAKYLQGDDFKKNVKMFLEDIGALARGIHWIVDHIPGAKTVDTVLGAGAGFLVGGPLGAVAGAGLGAMAGTIDQHLPGTGTSGLGTVQDINSGRGRVRLGRHNPGNLRVPGSKTAFQDFDTDEAGVQQMARQLLLYQDRDKLNTIGGIVSKYAPSNENNTKAYINAVVGRTGYSVNQKLDLHDPSQMAAVISAMLKQENAKANAGFTKDVVIKIVNNTGGNAVVAAAQLPH